MVAIDRELFLEGLAIAIERKLDRVVPDEKALEMTEARIDTRIGCVGLLEAGRRLQCKNRAQTLAFLRRCRIPVIVESRERKFVLVSDIEQHLAGARRELPAEQGTEIQRVGGQKSAVGLAPAIVEAEDAHAENVRKAIEVIREEKKATTSLLQRRLYWGYAFAERVMKSLEQMGIVGPGVGAKPREIFWQRLDEGVPA